MPTWNHTLNVKDIWDDFEKNGLSKSVEWIAARIRTSSFWKDGSDFELIDIVESIEGAEDLEDFNYAWDWFYDYADSERIWVKTF